MNITMAIDYYDLIWKSRKLFGREHINCFLGQCAEHGIDTVQWRLSVCGKLLYHTKTGDMLESIPAEDLQAMQTPHCSIVEKAKAIMAEIDPLEVAVELAHKHGLKILPWLTLYDDRGYFRFSQSSLVAEHPEFCWRSENGEQYYSGVTSYVYPEVISFRMRQLNEILSYGGDGLHLSNRTHSRPPEYFTKRDDFLRKNPDANHNIWLQVVGESLAEIILQSAGQYGFDPPAVNAYKKITGRLPGKTDAEWWNFRGNYFTDFMKEVRKVVDGTLSFGLRYISGSPYPYGDKFFDWNTLLNIVDELHYELPENKSVPAMLESCPELESPSRSLKLGWCWLGPHCREETIRLKAPPIKDLIEAGFLNGAVLFEACNFWEKPEYWKLIRYFCGC